MASSNRHWPSMFKSKPCHPHQHQWQHDINPPAVSSRSVPFSSVGGCEERSPEPKPRWNPKPEQIRILETVFNSGIVNPPRDEIRRIRSQLQEYGPVGDANVFYWFQNRKSRSKHKQRHFQTTTKSQRTDSLSPPGATATGIIPTLATTPPSSSSSSSDKSSQKLVDKAFSVDVLDALNSPTAVNQPYFRTAVPGEFLPEPFFFPMYRPPTAGLTNGGAVFTQGFCFPELSANVVHGVPHDETVGNCSGLLLTDLMMNYGSKNKKKVDDHEKVLPISAHTILPPVTLSVPSTMNHIQGEGQGKSTVFINDVVFEVAEGPFNVREAFGDDAVLIHSSGQPVVTNEWGVTLQSLQHGAFYYLVRMA